MPDTIFKMKNQIPRMVSTASGLKTRAKNLRTSANQLKLSVKGLRTPEARETRAKAKKLVASARKYEASAKAKRKQIEQIKGAIEGLLDYYEVMIDTFCYDRFFNHYNGGLVNTRPMKHARQKLDSLKRQYGSEIVAIAIDAIDSDFPGKFDSLMYESDSRSPGSGSAAITEFDRIIDQYIQRYVQQVNAQKTSSKSRRAIVDAEQEESEEFF